jgi:hypothetical protein
VVTLASTKKSTAPAIRPLYGETTRHKPRKMATALTFSVSAVLMEEAALSRKESAGLA